jgi:hypothetical protein
MKCVVTRDKNGRIDFWSSKENPVRNADGDWYSTLNPLECNSIIFAGCSCAKGVSKLLGFTPRKGSRQKVEITVKKLK